MYQKTALIVDDSPTSQAVLKRLLKDFDYHVDAQKSGEDALLHLQTNTADVIFLDHIMPGIDGFGVLRQLKSNPLTRQIPVVMYTSQNAQRYANEARALGAIGVLPKQVGNKELAHILERAEQANSSSASAVAGENIVDNDVINIDVTDTAATVLAQTEQQTEIELLKQALHTELEQQRRDLMAQQRELTAQLERQLLTQTLHIAHWQQRSHWRSIAAGILILLPLLAAIHFSSKVSDQQAELARIQIALQKQQQEWQQRGTSSTLPAVSNDHDQSKADWEDVKFMLETLIATVESQARAGKPIHARQVMQKMQATTELSQANAGENPSRDATATAGNEEGSEDKP